MKHTTIISIIVAILVAFVTWAIVGTIREGEELLDGEQATTTGSRVMSVESYVEANISELSPEKEVLGGTFYVTDMEIAGGRGVVSYEDGHNAYAADFTYTVDEESGISIDSFVIRK